MSIPQYLKSKYGFADNANVPVEFLCEELLLSQREVLPILKAKLPKREWGREMLSFIVFCTVVDEVLQGC